MSLKSFARQLDELEGRMKRGKRNYAEVDLETPLAIVRLVETNPGVGMARYLEYIGRHGFGLEDILNQPDPRKQPNC